MNFFKVILFAFLIFSSSNMNATHILSSNMTYECTSPGYYTFTMIMHRDCNSGGPFFDQEIPITVYQGTELLFSQYEVIKSTDEIVYEPYADCDPNAEIICIEKGIYSFELNLPVIDENYHIVYQRCCWAADILNILDPDETGITVESVITPKGQEVCNSQTPIEFPMAITSCPNVPFSFSIPNMDSEGDELDYQLCTPLKGGGLEGSSEFPGDPTSCYGIIPNPACPPPYDQVIYADGFTEENPFPTVNGFNFNNETNILEFTPSEIGRYVFGLCVKEYQDGDLVGYHTSIGSLANVVMPLISSTKNQEINQWTINYSNRAININSPTSISNTKIQVFSPIGQLIYTREVKNLNYIEIPTRNYSTGTYYVRISENGHSSIKKVVIY